FELYRKVRRRVDALVGRLNSAFATSRWAPVHYIYRSLSERELVALYRAADVMLVTPVRDGMNLVAKEFVAARTDEDGVLVLSEFAGAAAELAEALHVNPYDVDRTSETYYHALTLPAEERRARMLGLRRRVTTYDVEHWVRSFLGALEAVDYAGEPAAPRPLPPMEWRERALAILEQAAARTPGSLVEHKTVSLAWHYRMADPEFGAAQANELRLHLTELLSNLPVEIVAGAKMIEVRPHG